MCKQYRAGGEVKNPNNRTETNQFQKSKCLFMFKESCALPHGITRRMLNYFNGYFSCYRIFGEIGYFFFEKERVWQCHLDVPDLATLCGGSLRILEIEIENANKSYKFGPSGFKKEIIYSGIPKPDLIAYMNFGRKTSEITQNVALQNKRGQVRLVAVYKNTEPL